MRRCVGGLLVVVVLPGAIAACQPDEPRGDAPPSPSACVEQYIEGLEARGEQLASAPPADPYERLLYDRLTYRISGADFMRYAIQRATEPEEVPDEYRLAEDPVLDGTDPLTGVVFQAMWEYDCLPREVVDQVLVDVGLALPGDPLPGEADAPGEPGAGDEG